MCTYNNYVSEVRVSVSIRRCTQPQPFEHDLNNSELLKKKREFADRRESASGSPLLEGPLFVVSPGGNRYCGRYPTNLIISLCYFQVTTQNQKLCIPYLGLPIRMRSGLFATEEEGCWQLCSLNTDRQGSLWGQS